MMNDHSRAEPKRARQRAREERDDRARIAALEDEVAVAQREVDELEHQNPEQHPDTFLGRAAYDPSMATKWLGAPALLRLSRRFEGTLSDDRFEQLVERIREVMHDPGVVEVKPGSLVWASRLEHHHTQSDLMVRVTTTAHHTTLAVTDKLEMLVGRLFGAFGSVVGAGGIALPVAAAIAFPAYAPAFVIGWLGGVFGTTRMVYKRLAKFRARRLHEVFGALVIEIEPHLRAAQDASRIG